MLAVRDLRELTNWCRTRRLTWTPAQLEDGAAALSLQRVSASTPWTNLFLVAEDAGFTLLDASGRMLAAASDLPALLDAVDGGVAEPPFAWAA